jgi:hypothetical protein
MSIRKWAIGLAASAAITAGVAVPATAAFASPASPAHNIPVTCASPVNHDQLSLKLGTSTYNYKVRLQLQTISFFPRVEVVSGTLCDNYEPVHIALPVHGIVFGNVVVISVQYPSTGPDAGNQGVRTFSGVIGPFGHVIGSWSETGAEAGAGTFTLASV